MSLIFRPTYAPSPIGGVFRDLDRLQRAVMADFFDEMNSRGTTSEMLTNDPEKFAVTLDVSHFKPEELKVNLDGNVLTVEGKQEQKDEHHFMERSFMRKWTLPKNADLSALKSQLSDEGRLSIEAPKINKPSETSVPIPIERH